MMEEPKRRFEMVPVDVLEIDRGRLRRMRNRRADAELLASVKARGVLVPIVVFETERGYRVVAGTRRVECARELGLEVVPAIVVEAGEEWGVWATVAENRLREGVNALDEARFVVEQVRQHGYTQGQMAEVLGVSEGWVEQRVGIMSWPVEVRQALERGEVSFGVGRELSRIRNAEYREQCVRSAVQSGCTTRRAAQWVRDGEAEEASAKARAVPLRSGETPSLAGLPGKAGSTPWGPKAGLTSQGPKAESSPMGKGSVNGAGTDAASIAQGPKAESLPSRPGAERPSEGPKAESPPSVQGGAQEPGAEAVLYRPGAGECVLCSGASGSSDIRLLAVCSACYAVLEGALRGSV